MPALIVLGDRTDHGGEVIEASGVTDTHNRRIARIGDKVYCPKKGHGTTVIIEGDLTFVIDGQGAAYHGCRTSCGAILISSQVVTSVEFGDGDGSHSTSSQKVPPASAPLASARSTTSAFTAELQKPDEVFDEQFELRDSDGNLLVYMPYTVRFVSGEVVHGETDTLGKTKRYATNGPQFLELFLGHSQGATK